MSGCRPTVVVVGAGAAGTLTALHLVRSSGRRSTSLDLCLVDPAPAVGAGTGFGTTDDEHLLNVPAAGMSALPEDPGHFVTWRRRVAPGSADPFEFAPRRDYARYLEETLRAALATAGDTVALNHVRRTAVRLDVEGHGVVVRLDDGTSVEGDAAVVATGLPSPSSEWAPGRLHGSAFFVPDPWAPGALDVVRRDQAGPADVLVVGTGLTMVDVAQTVLRSARPDRTVHAVSRSGLLPERHADALLLAATPEVSQWGDELESIAANAARHLRAVEAATGDWRPAMDGLRFQVSTLWRRLDEGDRLRFLRERAGEWNRLRHRVPAGVADNVDALVADGRLAVAPGHVLAADPLPLGGLRVELSDGTRRDVGWVVNCTGPREDVRELGNPLLDDLLRTRGGASVAVPSTAGMGFRTDEVGRLLASTGEAKAPVWTLGALRRGDLWESTAVPEIRTQALAVAGAVLDQVAPLPRRLADGRLVSGHHPVARPRDPLGLPISTTAEAALAFGTGLERLMRLQSGAEDLLVRATELDPGFAIAHAALALLGHEAGATTDVTARLSAAQESVRARGDERERSLVDVVTARIEGTREAGRTALFRHVASHPRDVLAVSAAVPTIAFSGVTDVRQDAWELVEGLGQAYGDHWWYISLLAFVRQDQSRFDEAGLLAESALACEPSSGHGVHALAHVLYETGRHEVGRTWLDHWVTESGRSASHRAHFSWHAALHELALGDTEAVRQRYYSQLAPPVVTGVRSLVDSASLLWRWRVTGHPGPIPPVEPILAVVDEGLLVRPQTPFTGLHAAVALAAADDVPGLHRLVTHCRRSSDPVLSTVVATVGDALLAQSAGDHTAAADLLAEVMPRLVDVGGSAAQREVVEETLHYCLRRAAGQASATTLDM